MDDLREFKYILPKAYQARANNTLDSIGFDSLEKCVDKKLWLSHLPITYNFNSLGYRDSDWNTTDYWVIGDSFSMGLGQPYEETWPRLLELKLNVKINKVCCNGAGNDWIDTAYQLVKQRNPKKVFVMWSFVYRQMSKDSDILLLSGYEKLTKIKNFSLVEKHIAERWQLIFNKYAQEDILFSFVPDWNQLLDIRNAELDSRAVKYQIMDRARDGFHFGPKTSDLIAENFIKKL